MPSVFIKTYGCQMNERDSEAVAAQLLAKGYQLADAEESADVILLNTCSVRDFAEQKALNKMRSLATELKRRRPEVVLGFLGCMAQSRGQALLDRLPDVDLVLGTQKMHHAGDYLDALREGRHRKVVDTAEETDSESRIREHLVDGKGKKAVSAFVSIMQGCNQYCTFCIVPHTRGQERSRPIPDIVAECRELVGRGVKEITLLGQIVTSYGRGDLPPKDGRSPFVQLLDAVHSLEGLERLRFTAPHPKGYGDDLVEAYARLPKLMPSAHIPVQSGSDRVLKLMHRGYNRERFRQIIRKLRAVQPAIGLITDFIVGFPGETEADFQETLALAREVQFDQAFIFKYSPRRDTPAAAMAGQLPRPVIEDRHAQLLALMNDLGRQRYQSLVGQITTILVEGPSKRNPSRLMGRTPCNKIVVFDGSERHLHQLVPLKIVRAGNFTLYGDCAIHGLH
mgnify:CR=1 FL=1